MRAKFYIFLCLMLSFSLSFGAPKGGGAPVSVRGYIKSNGTYVAPHYRSAPDGNVYNNWSTVGNTNPYTGEVGKKNPLSGAGLAAASEASAKRSEAAILASPEWLPDVAEESPNSLFDQLYTKSLTSTGAGKSSFTPHSLDLRALSSAERQSIDLACISARSDGPATMNKCLANQLAAFDRGPRAPDLRALSTAERQSIDLACISAIRFGAGIAATDIAVSRLGGNLVLAIASTDDSITINNWNSSSVFRNERAEFADGTVWSGADVEAAILVAAPPQVSVIYSEASVGSNPANRASPRLATRFSLHVSPGPKCRAQHGASRWRYRLPRGIHLNDGPTFGEPLF